MLLEAILILIIIVYLLHSWHLGYWKRRNIFSVYGEFTFGTLPQVFLKKKHFQDMFLEMYEKYKSYGLIGFYTLYTPMLLVTDPELIKTVLVKDFNKFVDSGMDMGAKTDPLFGLHPFNAKGIEKWKKIRGIHTSVLTTTKFKEIIPVFLKVAKTMVSYLEKKQMETIVANEMTFLYTVDNTCTFGFGVEPSAFTDPENSFIKYANSEKVFSESPLAFASYFFFPKASDLLGLRVLSKDAEDFFKTLAQKTVEYRVKNKFFKNDLIDYLIKLNKQYSVENKPEMTNVEIAAHFLTFYADSSSTTSIQIAYCLFDLAQNQNIQEKLRKEISLVGKTLDEFDYEKINSIDYLAMVINETLRIHAPASWLSRTCTEDTYLRNSIISKGTKIFVPVGCIHNDPDYFPSPKNYDPERFSQENKDSMKKYTYLPFGEGPRQCLGLKFALIQIKLALISILLNFKFVLSDEYTENNSTGNSIFKMPGADAKLKFQLL